MRDETIRVGDLVMVVRGHACLMEQRGGVFFTVTEIVRPMYGGYRCPACGAHSLAKHDNAAHGTETGNGCVPLSWLKKIDPLAEPAHVEREEAACMPD